MFKPVDSQVDFPKTERDVLSFWSEGDVFSKSIENRRGGDEFIFYDGPPFATGLPHYGHLLAGTIKDVVPRYQTMKGRRVERVFGWDCHGLPIEALAQDALGISGGPAIKELGVGKFNEQCRSMVLTYVDEWEKTVTRMGRWVDFEHGYKTMDTPFMETIWWVFKELWRQKRVYRAHRIMPYSWKLNTPLSNFEANRNYQDVQDPSVTVRMRVLSCPIDVPDNCYFLAWTTTPWTLPENLALCAGPDIDYLVVKDASGEDAYVMAEARLSAYYKSEDEYEVLRRFKGVDLRGATYEPLFPYFADQPNAFTVLNDSFVTTDDGTGIVHMAPAYGEDDYRVCRGAGIDLVDPLDEDAKFTDRVPDFAGTHCKEADKAIIKWLKNHGKLVHQSVIVHSYPFCERTDTPLIYRAIDAWYVKVEDLRERLLANNGETTWVPEYVGEKRFANWLAEAKDWNISRNRFWGSCIPVWVNQDDAEDMICVGSIKELEELSGRTINDLHKHYIDDVVIEKDGKTYKRTPEVLDCWFESGSMPYAQRHYPFSDKEAFDANFPADFIAEGLDQTRGWFYTLNVLSTALFDKPAFKNVIVNGLVLAEDGKKMSKRLKNYPDPNEIMEKYGADALRLCMLGSPVVRAEDLCFSENGVRECMRTVIIPIWNAYSFFVTYARVDAWTPTDGEPPENPANPLDRWILASLSQMIEEITGAMDHYFLQRAANRFEKFVEDLTNWYIRRSRRRFWKSSNDDDKDQAYRTLHHVLIRFCETAAPFIPFITETIFRNLRTDDMVESVHLRDFPTPDQARRDVRLERQMDLTMIAVSLGRFLRSNKAIKTRQPLAKAFVVSRDGDELDMLRETASIIANELNVKEIEYGSDERELVSISAKPDFKKLGPKLGKKMKEAAALIQALNEASLNDVLTGNSAQITLSDGDVVEIARDDIIVNRTEKRGVTVATDKGITVALDATLTPALIEEGVAREFVSKVQALRKDAGLDVTDRIEIQYQTDDDTARAIENRGDYIRSETLAEELRRVDTLNAGEAADVAVNDAACLVLIRKKDD